MPQILIIAYGNPLRSDDGVAWRAAEALGGKFPESEVEIICLQQLGPELAESVGRCRRVIFVDAASGGGQPGEVRVAVMQDTSSSPVEAHHFCHALSPSSIVGLATRLYGGSAQAFSATITGQNFDHGESLSLPVEAALPSLVARIQELIHTCPPNTSNS